MAQEVRAVYEDGRLRVLDPVNLAEGEQVQLMILGEQESNDRLVAAGLTPLVFVSADTRLLAVAIAESLMTDDPNAHP